ncbi:hypothetical protein Tco_0232737, partial [Tanacetum coccineum]
MDETMYQAWGRYSDLLYRCPQHDLKSQQKVQIFYTGLHIHSRKMINSQGFIPMMTPAQALKSIQVMADHSHNWYDGASTRQGSNDSSDDIDMQKLNENIHVIQVSCKICDGTRLTQECLIRNESKTVNQVNYIGFLEETVNQSWRWKEQEDDPYITRKSVYTIGFFKRISEEELKLLIAKDTQSSLTEMKAHSCIVNTYEKSEPFIDTQKLNPLQEESQSSRSSTIPSSISNEDSTV